MTFSSDIYISLRIREHNSNHLGMGLSFESFVKLPDDIHREISVHFRNQLGDVLSLLSVIFDLHPTEQTPRHANLVLQTCKYLYEAPHLWLIALESYRTGAPLPCPPGQDLSSLTLPALRHLGHMAARLLKNWSRNLPLPLRTTHLSLRQDTAYGLLSVIPGTYLVLVIPSMEGATPHAGITRIECWDVRARKCVGSVIVGSQSRFSAPCMDVFGKFTIAASLLQRDAGEGEMYVYCPISRSISWLTRSGSQVPFCQHVDGRFWRSRQHYFPRDPPEGCADACCS